MSLKLLIALKNYSSWSMRPWLVMRHFGILFEEVEAPLFVTDDGADLIRSWSAAGKVPVLKDGDLTVWDSLAIMEYLAEKFPGKPLWPADLDRRALARSVSAEMHSGFANLRGEMPMNVNRVYPGYGYSTDCTADIGRVCAIWRGCIEASGGPFLFGEFSIADAMYAPVVTRLRTYDVTLDDVCTNYGDRVLALPATAQWLGDAKADPRRIDRYEFD